MKISEINFEKEADVFCQERGLDRTAPIVINAMKRGAELAVANLTKDVVDVIESLDSDRRKGPPAHGDKSGTLGVNGVI